MKQVTRALLGEFVEQPEPSTEGDWYMVRLQDLIDAGHEVIEFHFEYTLVDDEAQAPNMTRLLREDEDA